MDFFEVDFVKAGDNKSGDAIALRYRRNNETQTSVHVVDGGYTEDGQKLVDHINSQYGSPERIDNVILTHPDRDHAGGLMTVLESFEIGTLWMNRPWNHIADLLPMFEYEYTEEGLVQRLKRDFPNTAALEKAAENLGIEVRDVFQGTNIGGFLVLSPSRDFYLELVVASEKTPEAEREASFTGQVYSFVRQAIRSVSALWGVETGLLGGTEGTSAENEMSVIQLGIFSSGNILLTGDSGVKALDEAYNYAIQLGIQLPGLTHFQVPHHGSRHNLSTEILDKWLGQRLPSMPSPGQYTVATLISAHENDEDHPRKSVVRALWHRGANVCSTEDKDFIYWKPTGQPFRSGTSGATGLEYPGDTEE